MKHLFCNWKFGTLTRGLPLNAKNKNLAQGAPAPLGSSIHESRKELKSALDDFFSSPPILKVLADKKNHEVLSQLFLLLNLPNASENEKEIANTKWCNLILALREARPHLQQHSFLELLEDKTYEEKRSSEKKIRSTIPHLEGYTFQTLADYARQNLVFTSPQIYTLLTTLYEDYVEFFYYNRYVGPSKTFEDFKKLLAQGQKFNGLISKYQFARALKIVARDCFGSNVQKVKAQNLMVQGVSLKNPNTKELKNIDYQSWVLQQTREEALVSESGPKKQVVFYYISQRSLNYNYFIEQFLPEFCKACQKEKITNITLTTLPMITQPQEPKVFASRGEFFNEHLSFFVLSSSVGPEKAFDSILEYWSTNLLKPEVQKNFTKSEILKKFAPFSNFSFSDLLHYLEEGNFLAEFFVLFYNKTNPEKNESRELQAFLHARVGLWLARYEFDIKSLEPKIIVFNRLTDKNYKTKGITYSPKNDPLNFLLTIQFTNPKETFNSLEEVQKSLNEFLFYRSSTFVTHSEFNPTFGTILPE